MVKKSTADFSFRGRKLQKNLHVDLVLFFS
jgi:hypothetical protein